jgi:hypothetical protein
VNCLVTEDLACFLMHLTRCQHDDNKWEIAMSCLFKQPCYVVVHESTNFSDNFGDLIVIAGSKSIDVHVCTDRQYYICGKVVL